MRPITRVTNLTMLSTPTKSNLPPAATSETTGCVTLKYSAQTAGATTNPRTQTAGLFCPCIQQRVSAPRAHNVRHVTTSRPSADNLCDCRLPFTGKSTKAGGHRPEQKYRKIARCLTCKPSTSPTNSTTPLLPPGCTSHRCCTAMPSTLSFPGGGSS